MSDSSWSGRLRVLPCPEGDPGVWAPLVSEVTAMVGLLPSFEDAPGRADEPSTQQALLTYAATTADPVLVLPADQPPGRVGPRPVGGRVRQVLVATDRSPNTRLLLRQWIPRLQSQGAEVEQLHVLAASTVPAFWEGPGHHANAWHAEVRRRHGAGEGALSVRTGDPADAIAEASAHVDLVMISWKGETSSGRALVLRRVLAVVRRPVLLVRAPRPNPGTGREGLKRAGVLARRPPSPLRGEPPR